MLNTQQIGKCGELLVQYKLLLFGIESARLTTDSGIDLVAYSPQTKQPVTIQVKTNLQPKKGGGKGKLSLDWWVPEDSPAELIALTELTDEKIWMFYIKELTEIAQQHSNGRLHIYMYIDPTVKTRKKNQVFAYEFEAFLLKNRLHELF